VRLGRDGARSDPGPDRRDARKVADEVNQLGSAGIAKKSRCHPVRGYEKAVDEIAREFKTIDILGQQCGNGPVEIFIDTDEPLWDKFISVNYKHF